MKKKIIRSLIIVIPVLTLFADNARFKTLSDGNDLVLGFERFPQPPLTGTVKLIDAKIGISATQVCGYTDWTTAQIHLPQQLLSKEYWAGVGKDLQKQAVAVVENIGGAIPGMLVCNMSPTFCNLYNQAEMMAAFETQLTFDTCQVLEGVNDVTRASTEYLSSCVKKKTSGSENVPAMNNSKAREQCINSDADASHNKSSSLTTAAEGEDRFTMAEFVKSLFPDLVVEGMKTTDNKYTYAIDGNKNLNKYRNVQTANLFKQLIPGVTLTAGFRTVHGGSEQTIDTELRAEALEIYNELKDILVAMYDLKIKGMKPNNIIADTTIAAYWTPETNQVPKAIWMASSDGSEPLVLVSSSVMLDMLSTIDVDVAKISTDVTDNPPDVTVNPSIKNMLERVATATARYKLKNSLEDIISRATTKCISDDKLQGATAQKVCSDTVKKATSDIHRLDRQAVEDERLVSLNREIANYIQSSKRYKGALSTDGMAVPSKEGEIHNPNTL